MSILFFSARFRRSNRRPRLSSARFPSFPPAIIVSDLFTFWDPRSPQKSQVVPAPRSFRPAGQNRGGPRNEMNSTDWICLLREEMDFLTWLKIIADFLGAIGAYFCHRIIFSAVHLFFLERLHSFVKLIVPYLLTSSKEQKQFKQEGKVRKC